MVYQENGVIVLDWPGNSPDLNPIENIWYIIKARLKFVNAPTRKTLIKAVKREWDNLSIELFEKLARSMPRRIQMVLEANGGSIRYQGGVEYHPSAMKLQIYVFLMNLLCLSYVNLKLNLNEIICNDYHEILVVCDHICVKFCLKYTQIPCQSMLVLGQINRITKWTYYIRENVFNKISRTYFHYCISVISGQVECFY